MKIRKAIIAAAGQGTRFLPQTKAIPKEMLPLIDKPIIQYIVEELVAAGVEVIVIVTSRHKRSIEDHFDEPSSDLVETLMKGDASKQQLLKELQTIAKLANFIYIRQKGLSGNAVPILNAESIIGDEPFIYTFGDDFIKADPNRFNQLVDIYDRYGLSVLSCLQADNEINYKQYGYVGGKAFGEGLIEVQNIVEKPGSKAAAPSSLASLSSYIFNPTIFKSIHAVKESLKSGEELLLQTAIQYSIDHGEKILAYEIENAKYYDSGNKLEYLKTIVDLGLQHPDIGKSFSEYVRNRIKQ